MDVDKVYSTAKESVSDGFSFLEVVHLIIVTMTEVGKLKRMTGDQRKQLVKEIVVKIIEEKGGNDKEKALQIVEDVGDTVIDGMYWAGKQSKRVFRKAKGWCGCV